MERLREVVRQELRDVGWLVTSKDALKFGAHFLLYRPPTPHSIVAVLIFEDVEEFTFLEAQRFSRLCETVGKTALVIVPKDEGLRYISIDRWTPHISLRVLSFKKENMLRQFQVR